MEPERDLLIQDGRVRLQAGGLQAIMEVCRQVGIAGTHPFLIPGGNAFFPEKLQELGTDKCFPDRGVGTIVIDTAQFAARSYITYANGPEDLPASKNVEDNLMEMNLFTGGGNTRKRIPMKEKLKSKMLDNEKLRSTFQTILAREKPSM